MVRAMTADADGQARVRAALEGLARSGRTMTYKDLAELAGVPEPHRIHRLTGWLEALARQDHAEGRPILAAVAVSRARGGLPGRGFFMLMTELGRYAGPTDGPEAAHHHTAEIGRVFDAFRGSAGA